MRLCKLGRSPRTRRVWRKRVFKCMTQTPSPICARPLCHAVGSPRRRRQRCRPTAWVKRMTRRTRQHIRATTAGGRADAATRPHGQTQWERQTADAKGRSDPSRPRNCHGWPTHRGARARPRGESALPQHDMVRTSSRPGDPKYRTVTHRRHSQHMSAAQPQYLQATHTNRRQRHFER